MPINENSSRTEVLEAVSKNYNHLQYVPEKFRKDEEIVLKAVLQSDQALRFVSEEFQRMLDYKYTDEDVMDLARALADFDRDNVLLTSVSVANNGLDPSLTDLHLVLEEVAKGKKQILIPIRKNTEHWIAGQILIDHDKKTVVLKCHDPLGGGKPEEKIFEEIKKVDSLKGYSFESRDSSIQKIQGTREGDGLYCGGYVARILGELSCYHESEINFSDIEKHNLAQRLIDKKLVGKEKFGNYREIDYEDNILKEVEMQKGIHRDIEAGVSMLDQLLIPYRAFRANAEQLSAKNSGHNITRIH